MAFQLDFEARSSGGVWKLTVFDDYIKLVLELTSSDVAALKYLIEMQGF